MFTSTLTTETVSICELERGDVLLLGSDEVPAKVQDVSLGDGDVVLTYDEGVGTDFVVFDRLVTLPASQRVRRVI